MTANRSVDPTSSGQPTTVRSVPDAALETVLVLVHGSYHGAWCWDRVLPYLVGRVKEVLTPELPFEGVDADVRHLTMLLDELGTSRVVVCGHSYGGRVMSIACADRNVARVIYLAANMLDQQQVEQLFAAGAERNGRRAFADFDFEYVWSRYYADCSETDVRDIYEKLRLTREEPLSVESFASRPWERTPSGYIVCTDDQVVSGERQRAMAANASVSRELPASHSPFVSMPRELAETLIDWCR